MSYNGSGTFAINSTGQPVVAGTVISSTVFNSLTADLGTGLSTAITKDGQTTTTARILFAAGISSTLATDATSISTGSILTLGGLGVTKAAWIGGLMNVAGAATFQSTIGITGALTATTINASGLVAMAGAATVGTTLAVTGTTTAAAINASGTVAMAGAATVGTTLAVTGTSTMAAINATGIISAPVGSVGSPSFSFTGDTTLGMYRVGAQNGGLVASSGIRLQWDGTSVYVNNLVIDIGNANANISRLGAGSLAIGTGAIGSTAGSLTLTNLTALGTLGVTGATTIGGLLTQNANALFSSSGGNNFRFHALGDGFGGGSSNVIFSADAAPGSNMYLWTAVVDYNGTPETIAALTSNGSLQLTASSAAGTINLDLYNIIGNESDHYYTVMRLANGTAIGSIRQVSTTSAVVYNTTSDYRIKDLFGSFTTAREMLSALTVHDGQFKGSEHRIPLLVAHEVQSVTPWAVMGEKDAVDDEGAPVYQQMGTGAHEALLIAGWQDHEARLASLQADFQAYKNSHP